MSVGRALLSVLGYVTFAAVIFLSFHSIAGRITAWAGESDEKTLRLLDSLFGVAQLQQLTLTHIGLVAVGIALITFFAVVERKWDAFNHDLAERVVGVDPKTIAKLNESYDKGIGNLGSHSYGFGGSPAARGGPPMMGGGPPPPGGGGAAGPMGPPGMGMGMPPPGGMPPGMMPPPGMGGMMGGPAPRMPPSRRR